MPKRGIVSTGCKVLGVYALVLAAESVPLVFIGNIPRILSGSFELTLSAVAACIPFFLYLAVAFCLIQFPDTITDVLCRGEEDGRIEGGLSRETAQEIAFSAVGLFVLLTAIAFVPTIVLGIFAPSPFGLTPGYGWLCLLSFILQSTIGCYLFLRSPGLVRLLDRRGAAQMAGPQAADEVAGEHRRVEETKEGWDETTLKKVAFAVAGLLLIVNAIQYLPGNLLQLLSPDHSTPISYAGHVAGVVVTPVKMAIGLYLVLGARGLVNLIRRLRSA